MAGSSQTGNIFTGASDSDIANGGCVMDNKLERLRLLIDSLVMQAQMETDEKRKAMITANVQKLSKRYTEERIKGKVEANEQ
jgi:hypothetical protein